MRDIKFRAWVNLCDGSFTMSPHEEIVKSCGAYLCDNDKFPNRVIMQFTGLQDKNGVDIYEGDIINDQFDCGQLVVILWNDDKACFESKDVKFCAMMERHYQRPISICTKTITKGVVIGNKFESPELLEQ